MNLLANNVAQLLGDAGLTIIIGLVVVFSVLVLLVVVIKVFGEIMSRLDRVEKAVAPSAPAAAPAVAPVTASAVAVGNTAPVSSSMEIQNGIADETVAAISGAIACMAPAGKQYAVRRIVKK
ncbi:MAG: OadG family protein [Clostridia bacterium]|nr:OadG family protein [Clostridia bacterium]